MIVSDIFGIVTASNVLTKPFESSILVTNPTLLSSRCKVFVSRSIFALKNCKKSCPKIKEWCTFSTTCIGYKKGLSLILTGSLIVP